MASAGMHIPGPMPGLAPFGVYAGSAGHDRSLPRAQQPFIFGGASAAPRLDNNPHPFREEGYEGEIPALEYRPVHAGMPVQEHAGLPAQEGAAVEVNEEVGVPAHEEAGMPVHEQPGVPANADVQANQADTDDADDIEILEEPGVPANAGVQANQADADDDGIEVLEEREKTAEEQRLWSELMKAREEKRQMQELLQREGRPPTLHERSQMASLQNFINRTKAERRQILDILKILRQQLQERMQQQQQQQQPPRLIARKIICELYETTAPEASANFFG